MEFNQSMLVAPPLNDGAVSAQDSATDKVSLDSNNYSSVLFREKVNKFQEIFSQSLERGDVVPSGHSYKHHFTSIHSEIGAAMYARELSMPKGAVAIGKIHKHPAMNILLKGKIVIVSESGRRVIEAPCVYASEPGVRRVAYVVEDCVWLNVLMTKVVGEENIDEIADFHTANSYEELGLLDSIDNAKLTAEEVA